MAINPAEITTKQVSELPPALPALESLLAHQIGDVLNKCTVQELVNLIKSESTSYKYEVKFIRAPNNAYITDNFDMIPGASQGLGKLSGIWSGWAICNGNNGTDNDDGKTYIGYGANYATVGQVLGEEKHTLTINEIPSHSHEFFINSDSGGSNHGVENAVSSGSKYTSDTSGGGQSHNNMQPSKVILKIMKL